MVSTCSYAPTAHLETPALVSQWSGWEECNGWNGAGKEKGGKRQRLGRERLTLGRGQYHQQQHYKYPIPNLASPSWVHLKSCQQNCWHRSKQSHLGGGGILPAGKGPNVLLFRGDPWGGGTPTRCSICSSGTAALAGAGAGIYLGLGCPASTFILPIDINGTLKCFTLTNMHRTIFKHSVQSMWKIKATVSL